MKSTEKIWTDTCSDLLHFNCSAFVKTWIRHGVGVASIDRIANSLADHDLAADRHIDHAANSIFVAGETTVLALQIVRLIAVII